MNVIEQLLGGSHRLKVLRFFLLNQQALVPLEHLIATLRLSKKALSRELGFFKTLGLIREKKYVLKITKGKKEIKKRTRGFETDRSFPYIFPLYNLVITASPVSREKMHKFFKGKKSVSLVALSGVFLSEEAKNISRPDVENPVDVIIVAKNGKRSDYDSFMSRLSAEVGKELDWAFFTFSEFEYRKGIHDKFLRDFFDYTHEVLLDRIV